MFRATQAQLLGLILATAWLCVTGSAAAQATDTTLTPTASLPPAPHIVVKSAPLPMQIQSAKKVFISNAGGELKDWFTGGPNRFYDEFYAAMQGWGHYELVGTPSDADLIFEIHAGGLYLTEADEIPKFELTIYDPKTHVTLWAFAERLDPALFKGHRDENFDKAMNRLMERVKQLVEPRKS